MDRVTSMAVFVKSVEMGSLSAAARYFDLSQAMVSKHIRGLEQSLGIRLLSLTTRQLSPTEAGRLYFQRCVQILGDIEEADREAMQLQSVPAGVIRMSAPVTFGELHLAPALADFMLQYPQITLEVDLTDRFSSLVEEGLDLAVRVGRLADSSLVAKRLGASKMVTCAAPDYLARYGEPTHPDQLCEHRCLHLSSVSTPGVWWYEDQGKPLNVEVHGPLRGNSIAMACQAAEQGVGIVFGPSFVLASLVGEGRLVPILREFESRPLDINALYPSNRLLQKKVRLLIDFLVERFARSKAWD
jgi:DNA-binding transcriptional LysR family regulator